MNKPSRPRFPAPHVSLRCGAGAAGKCWSDLSPLICLKAVEGFLAENHGWASVRARSLQVAGPTVSDVADARATHVTGAAANSTIWSLGAISAVQERRDMCTLAWIGDFKKCVAIFSLLLEPKSVIGGVDTGSNANTPSNKSLVPC